MNIERYLKNLNFWVVKTYKLRNRLRLKNFQMSHYV